jgi:hypothetical protein
MQWWRRDFGSIKRHIHFIFDCISVSTTSVQIC